MAGTRKRLAKAAAALTASGLVKKAAQDPRVRRKASELGAAVGKKARIVGKQAGKKASALARSAGKAVGARVGPARKAAGKKIEQLGKRIAG